MIWQLFAIVVISYLIGSINLSIIISKALGKGDIREQGSNNAGTTNTLRVLGIGPAIIVFIWDVLKGVLAILTAKWIASTNTVPTEMNFVYCYGIMLASIAVVLGHNFPIYFGFRGGKGVATSLGIILAIEWEIGLACLALGIVGILLTGGIISIGSLLASILYPILVWIMGGTFDTHFSNSYIKTIYIAFSFLMAASVILRHIPNIKRLYRGEEKSVLANRKNKDIANEIKNDAEIIKEDAKESVEKIKKDLEKAKSEVKEEISEAKEELEVPAVELEDSKEKEEKIIKETNDEPKKSKKSKK